MCIYILLIFISNETDAKGRKITIVKLPIPKPLYYTHEECQTLTTSTTNGELQPGYEIRHPGQRMAASYVNFYMANNNTTTATASNDHHKQAIIVPNFDCDEGIIIIVTC